MPRTKTAAAAIAVGGLMFAAGCGSSPASNSSSTSSPGSTVNAATATSVTAFGGMNGLVAAAKKEGTLNVITLPANWANYGTIMKDFTAKYGIKINDANPDGSSQDEINAMEQLKGQSRAPDVLDMGTAFAIKADQQACSPRTRWRPGAASRRTPRPPTAPGTATTAATWPSATTRPR